MSKETPRVLNWYCFTQKGLEAYHRFYRDSLYPITGEQAENDSWLMSENSGRQEVAFYKDEKGRYTRLWDGSFCDFFKDSRCRVVSQRYATEAAKAMR